MIRGEEEERRRRGREEKTIGENRGQDGKEELDAGSGELRKDGKQQSLMEHGRGGVDLKLWRKKEKMGGRLRLEVG